MCMSSSRKSNISKNINSNDCKIVEVYNYPITNWNAIFLSCTYKFNNIQLIVINPILSMNQNDFV